MCGVVSEEVLIDAADSRGQDGGESSVTCP